MAWLAVHMWLLLLVAFLLGLLLGWWIWHCRHDEMAPAAVAPAPEPAAPAPLPIPEPEPEPVDPNVPKLYTSASDGPADDLKKIRGVGPKLEKTLQDMGVYYFRQIASWTPRHVEWVDGQIEFPGRIVREQWVEQAKILRDGGETDFAKRYDKGETPSSYKDGETKG